jgi:uncharacterized repeat protein (TIGR01451 family)
MLASLIRRRSKMASRLALGFTLLILTLLLGCKAPAPTQNSNTNSNVTPTNPGCPTPSSCVFGTPPSPIDLSVVHRTVFAPGADATYVIHFNIAVGTTLTNVSISDTMSSTLTFVAAASSGWTCTFTTQFEFICSNPGPVAGQNNVISLSDILVNVAVPANASGTIQHSISATGIASGSYTGFQTQSVSDVIRIGESPVIDLSITKSHKPYVAFVQGSTGSYVISISNVGNVTTTGPATITDDLPTGLSFLSATNSPELTCVGTNNNHTAVCTTTAGLDPGLNDLTFGLNVGIDVKAPVGLISNTARVVTPGDSNTSNDSSTDSTGELIPPGVNLSITQNVTTGINFDGSLPAGKPLTLGTQIVNSGTVATSGSTTFTDSVPPGWNIGSLLPNPGWACSTALQLVTCTFSAPIQPATATGVGFEFLVDASLLGTTVTNTVAVSTPGDVFPGDDSSTIQYVIK